MMPAGALGAAAASRMDTREAPHRAAQALAAADDPHARALAAADETEARGQALIEAAAAMRAQAAADYPAGP